MLFGMVSVRNCQGFIKDTLDIWGEVCDGGIWVYGDDCQDSTPGIARPHPAVKEFIDSSTHHPEGRHDQFAALLRVHAYQDAAFPITLPASAGHREEAMKELTLKKCPFCGKNKAEALQVSSGYKAKERWIIRCQCGITTKTYAQKSGASERWNRRISRMAAGSGFLRKDSS